MHRTTTASAAAAGSLRIGEVPAVHRLGFGAMRITGAGIWGEPPDRDEAKRVLHRLLDLGVNLIDTADSYGPDVSERLIAETLHPYPSGLVIATKGGLLRDGPNQWRPDGRPEHLRRACEGSLRRLRLQRIDLYQLHRPDPRVPLEDSLGALRDLQQEGKIRDIGVSNVTEAELARTRQLVRVVSVQNRYSVTDRVYEGVLRECERMRIAFLPWAPLGHGTTATKDRTLKTLAARHDATTKQIVVAWLLAHSPVMLPIPGTSKVAHLEENVGAASITLSPEETAELDER